jgi:hypothetical protein
MTCLLAGLSFSSGLMAVPLWNILRSDHISFFHLKTSPIETDVEWNLDILEEDDK